jgi:hypothetical protein
LAERKIPLASNHYVLESEQEFLVWGGHTKGITLRTVPVRFESCTVIFDSIESDVWEKFSGRPIVTTIRYTVPLGAVVGSEVWKYDTPLYMSKDFRQTKSLETWVVTLKTQTKVILTDETTDIKNTTKSEGNDRVSIGFYDEAIARRVLEGFNHAAAICRGKEPF